MEQKTTMRNWILYLNCFVSLTLFGARVVPLPTLPCGELPNSEVVTNIVLNVDYTRLENLTFYLELNASASNSLSIAVGTASGDALALDEADFEWGYDCGTWFRADTATGNVDEWPEQGAERVSRTLTIDPLDLTGLLGTNGTVRRGNVAPVLFHVINSVTNRVTSETTFPLAVTNSRRCSNCASRRQRFSLIRHGTPRR